VWVGLDIPFTDFVNLTTTGHLAQLIISGDPNTIYVDNVFFYTGEAPPPPTGPSAAAPTPTEDAADVISLFSNAYTNVTVDTWSADWDNADVSDVLVVGDDVKLYENFTLAGIEFTSAPIDATSMNTFHMDIWTPDTSTGTEVFKIKLVDFGADGVWGGDDDVEHELMFDDVDVPANSWVGFDIAIADFTNLTTTGHLAQLILSSVPNTVYIDNIYFSGTTEANEDVTDATNSFNVLGSNYPNPFNPVTTIDFSIAKQGNVSLKVYDVKGRLVETLVEGTRAASSHSVTWSADNSASGIYFYRLSVNNKVVDTKRMILLK